MLSLLTGISEGEQPLEYRIGREASQFPEN